MREAAHEAGRDPNAIEITAAARPDPERIDQLRELGVARVTVTALGFEIEEVKRQLAAAADAVKQAAAF
jgi:hypothetical protein